MRLISIGARPNEAARTTERHTVNSSQDSSQSPPRSSQRLLDGIHRGLLVSQVAQLEGYRFR